MFTETDPRLKAGPSVTSDPSGTNPEKFDYTQYTASGLTLAQLDSFAKSFFNAPGSSWITLTLTGLRLIVALFYLYARSKIIDNALLVAKQEYQQDQGTTGQNEIGGDNLDTTG